VRVEVVYALSNKQSLVEVNVADDATVEQAIIASKLVTQYPEIDLQKNSVGIFSKKVLLQHRLRAGDRIEIYRSLEIDPKEARRIRAAKK